MKGLNGMSQGQSQTTGLRRSIAILHKAIGQEETAAFEDNSQPSLRGVAAQCPESSGVLVRRLFWAPCEETLADVMPLSTAGLNSEK